MTTFRRAHTKNYTVIHNSVAQDHSISWEALGLLTYLLSLPDDWRIYQSFLEKQRKSAGRDKIARIVNELIDARYLHVHYVGYPAKKTYFIFEEPIDDEGFKKFLQDCGFSVSQETRTSVDPQLQSKDSTQNKDSNNNNMTRSARDDAASEKKKVKKSPAAEGKKSKRSPEDVDISTLKLTDEEKDLAQKLLDECREVVIAAANPKGFVYAAVKDGYASSMIEKAKSREVEFEAINNLHERYKQRYESLNDPSILDKGYIERSRKGVILVKGELRKSFSISTADEFKQLVRRTYGKDLF